MNEMVLSEAQLQCLASPVRQEILAHLAAAGRASARELSHVLGRSPEAIHYHVRNLVRVGLVKEAFRRPAPRKPESVYELTSERLLLPEKATGDQAKVIRKAVLAGLRRTSRGLDKSMRHAEEHEADGAVQVVLQFHFRLGKDDSEQFIKMLEEAARFARSRQSEGSPLFHWSSVFYEEVP